MDELSQLSVSYESRGTSTICQCHGNNNVYVRYDIDSCGMRFRTLLAKLHEIKTSNSADFYSLTHCKAVGKNLFSEKFCRIFSGQKTAYFRQFYDNMPVQISSEDTRYSLQWCH